IATMYPIYDGQGGSTEWLLTNYLQWDGTKWLLGAGDYPGVQLTSADDIWLAQNLTDISATPSPAGQDWRVFTVAYTGDGLVNSNLARTETVYGMYDLNLTTVWTRVGYLHEIDTSNAGYVDEKLENVDWTFKDVDNSGVASLVATVTDTETITL